MIITCELFKNLNFFNRYFHCGINGRLMMVKIEMKIAVFSVYNNLILSKLKKSFMFSWQISRENPLIFLLLDLTLLCHSKFSKAIGFVLRYHSLFFFFLKWSGGVELLTSQCYNDALPPD